MSIIKESYSMVTIWICVFLLALTVLQPNRLNGQETPSAAYPNLSTSELMNKAAPDTSESIRFVVLLGEAGATEAIPMLEAKFTRLKDEITEEKIARAAVTVADLDKANVASVLIQLGDKHDAYWEFLVQQASLAVHSDLPEYLTYDSEEKSQPGPSPETRTWAEKHSIQPAAVAEESLYALPSIISLLGKTGDPRAVSLLRQALTSPNYHVEVAAARGLAKVQDSDSVPLIKGACEKAPKGVARAIAENSLLYFKDNESQNSVAQYVPEARLKALKALNHGPGTDPYK